MADFRIAHLMTKDVHTAEPATPLAEIAERMRTQCISCIVVCEGRVPVGMISERDLVRVLADGFRDGRLASPVAADIMSSPVSSIAEHSALSFAIAEASARRIRRLPVLDDQNELVGLVTQTDLLRAHQRELENLVLERTQALDEARRRLELLSLQDDRLGIGNRRAMEQALEQIHARARRHGRPYAVAVFTIDLFDQYQDCYGQIAADDLLRRVTERLHGTLRKTDSLYRSGDAEVLALLCETRLPGARRFAERTLAVVEGVQIPHCDSPRGTITLCCGVAAARPEEQLGSSFVSLLEHADHALQEARSAGGARVGVAADPSREGAG